MKYAIYLTFSFLLVYNLSIANHPIPDFLKIKTPWADSIFATLSIEEKIGQLIMVTAYAEQGETNEKLILSQIEEGKIGGILYLKTSPKRLAELTNQYQFKSKIPLFIGLDGENGLSFRLDQSPKYPNIITLGAIRNDTLLYEMGREIGQQCRTLGINLNFGPVSDINSNPTNTVINYRSFGENPIKVAQKSIMLAKGMQDEHILVSAKHFPGHGDTSLDSHTALPIINHNYKRLDSLELIPFRSVINYGINGIMTAHISMPNIDTTGTPATLSKIIIGAILRDSLHFQGLVFSDAMNMKGVLQNRTEAEAIVKALQAGVDVVEFVTNPIKAIEAIKKAITDSLLTTEQINQKCIRVLKSKEWAGINKTKRIDLLQLEKNLNQSEFKVTERKLIENSLTLLTNSNQIVPVQRFDTLHIATVAIGETDKTTFQKRLDSYTEIDHFQLPKHATNKQWEQLQQQLKNYNLIIMSVSGVNLNPSKQYGITLLQKMAVETVPKIAPTISVYFCNPLAISEFEGLNLNQAILLAYSNGEIENDLAAQAIMGAIDIQGESSISIKNIFPVGTGIRLKHNQSLGFTIPEEVGIDSELLYSKVDSICQNAVNDKYFPGCQVLIAKNGKVILQKSYGYHTYDKQQAVQNTDFYDWASITKIAGPLLPLMKLTENHIIDLDTPFCKYWKPFVNSNKKTITLRQILAHQAGLKSGLGFHIQSLKPNQKFNKEIYSNKPSDEYPIRVSENLYIHKDYKQIMFDAIATSAISQTNRYQYSDLGFHLFPDLITELTQTNYTDYLESQFYRPMGISACYNPYQKIPQPEIAPTEMDYFFRKELIHGFVHDEGAAMMGGISGHAGLFGSTLDLAKIMQTYLQKGYYGGNQYIDTTTINEFTKVQFPKNQNRRGLAFDKPVSGNASLPLGRSYPSPLVSDASFGHSGFTGTFTWADPKNGLLYIFLSNRVYPTRENTKLADSSLRIKLQHEIYKCQNTYQHQQVVFQN